VKTTSFEAHYYIILSMFCYCIFIGSSCTTQTSSVCATWSVLRYWPGLQD